MAFCGQHWACSRVHSERFTLVTALTFTFRKLDAQPARTWRDIALRACGSWLAAIGLMMGGFALAS